jgi:hypothetical protein
MFILSILLGVTSIAATSWLESPSVDDFTDCFMLVRGPSAIPGIKYERIAQQLWPLTLGYDVINESSSGTLPESITKQLNMVHHMIEASIVSSQDRITLFQSLAQLEVLYKEVVFTRGTANFNPSMIWKWAGRTSTDFVAMLRFLEPHALVIFAHFAILSDIFGATWFFNGWATKAVETISSHLHSPWKDLLKWPREQLENDLAQFRN